MAAAWLVCGDEPLLVGEAADAIRARARAEGYAGRELFFVERSFDWSELLASSQSLSLFSERRIIELKMPSPRPGKEGGAVLAQLCADPGAGHAAAGHHRAPGTRHLEHGLVQGLREERRGRAVMAGRDRPAAAVDHRPREPAGLAIDPEGAALLAERVEGNLLAAHQEIEKLALLHPGGTVGAEDVLAAVANSARYDVYQLGEAALDGDAERSLRILEGLRGEGTEPPLVLWALCRELRALAEARANPGARRRLRPPGRTPRGAHCSARSGRMAGQPLGPLFIDAGRVDRQIKGLGTGDPWTGLTGLVAAIAGVRLPQSPAA